MASRRAPNGAGTVVQRSDGRFQGSAYVLIANGGKKRVSVYGHTHSEVLRRLQHLAVQSDKGIPHAVGNWTVRAWLEHWLDGVVQTKNRPRTVETYRGIVERHLIPLLGSRRLDHLSVMHVQAAIDTLNEEGVGARTIQQVRAVLSAALSRAERNELVHRNVARLVELPNYQAKEIHPWTEREASTFLGAIRGHQWEIGYNFLLIYGMRRGEAIGVRWSDIDFDANTLRIRQQLQRIDGKVIAGEVKTAAGRRTLPLIPAIRSLLEAHASALGIDPATAPEDALILTSKTGAPIEPGNFARTFYLISEQTGLRRITVHQTRHTAATLLKSHGVQARDVQLILGHSNVSTTQQLYQHGYIDEHREMLMGVASALISTPLEATDALTSVALDTNCCQRQQLDSSEATDEAERQASETKEIRSLTGVTTADFLGGTSGARTHDTLLKSSLRATFAELPTPVMGELLTRAKRHYFGATVVKTVVNSDLDGDPALRIEGLRSARDGLQVALHDRFRRLSFPFSLLPAAPAMRRSNP